MNSQTIVMCVVALILGMLLANMLKSVCGCKVVEGQNGDESATRRPYCHGNPLSFQDPVQPICQQKRFKQLLSCNNINGRHFIVDAHDDNTMCCNGESETPCTSNN